MRLIMFGISSPKTMRQVDSPAALAASDEVAALQRQRLAAQDPRLERPEDEREDDDHRPHAAVLQVAGDDDEQRDRRDDEEDVDQEVDDLVDEPADVGGGDAEDRGDRGRERAPRRRRAAASAGRRATTCEKMSLPWSVVPKRWCQDGAWRAASRLKSFGCATEISGAISAMTTTNATIAEPEARLRVVRAAARASRGRAAGRAARRGGASRWSTCRVRGRAATSAGPQPRVEDEVEHVHDQVRDDHADGEHDEQRLRERRSRCPSTAC